jgi:hypothetical protein
LILPSSDPSPPQIGLHCGLNVLVPHDDGLDHLGIALRLPEPLFPLVCTQKGTTSQMDSEKECLEVFGNLISIQLRAGRYVVVNHQKMEFFLIAVLLVVHSGLAARLECGESISDNFLMVCFHLLSQVSSRCCLKSPVCHHGLLFTSCPVSVVKLLYLESIVTECYASQFCLLPESITASAGKLTESFNARRSAIDTFLFRIVPCNNLLSFISDDTRLNGKCRTLSCQNF